MELKLRTVVGFFFFKLIFYYGLWSAKHGNSHVPQQGFRLLLLKSIEFAFGICFANEHSIISISKEKFNLFSI